MAFLVEKGVVAVKRFRLFRWLWLPWRRADRRAEALARGEENMLRILSKHVPPEGAELVMSGRVGEELERMRELVGRVPGAVEAHGHVLHGEKQRELADGSPAAAESGLHVCPGCGSKLVQPTRWEPTASRKHWHLWRRCPECEWETNGVCGEREIDDFDEALDDGCVELTESLEAREMEGIEAMLVPFVWALERDLIDAEDFR